MRNVVYIAASIDGYIADENNSLDFLETISNPGNEDTGFEAFISTVDAIVMGRNSFEKVLSFGIEWPYTIPVFVWSSELEKVPEELESSVEIIHGSPGELVSLLHRRGYSDLYIDGGKTIQSFLAEDLIDEMVITTIPVLLGRGIPLFGDLSRRIDFRLESSETLLGQMVSTKFIRER